MLLKRILKYIGTIFYHPKYYNDEYGWYSIVDIKFRIDYWKTDALIVTENNIWYRVSYDWLMDNSVNKNGHPARTNKFNCFYKI